MWHDTHWLHRQSAINYDILDEDGPAILLNTLRRPITPIQQETNRLREIQVLALKLQLANAVEVVTQLLHITQTLCY